jgi:hypothetical protein
MQADPAGPPKPAPEEAPAGGLDGRAADPTRAPIATLRYELQAADHAAFLAGTKSSRRRARGMLASAAFAALMALNFLSGKLPVPANATGAAVEIAAILGIPVGAALWKLRHDRMAEAAELLPAPVAVTVHVFSDHAIEHRADRTGPLTHRIRTAHDLRTNRHHVALESDRAALVIPARAFADRKAMAALAEHWATQRT